MEKLDKIWDHKACSWGKQLITWTEKKKKRKKKTWAVLYFHFIPEQTLSNTLLLDETYPFHLISWQAPEYHLTTHHLSGAQGQRQRVSLISLLGPAGRDKWLEGEPEPCSGNERVKGRANNSEQRPTRLTRCLGTGGQVGKRVADTPESSLALESTPPKKKKKKLIAITFLVPQKGWEPFKSLLESYFIFIF